MDEDNYDDEQFEEDEVQQSLPGGTSQGEIDEPHSHSGLCSWKAISYDEIELGEQLGGGSMGLVHRGTYKGKPVAVKTLVSCIRHSICTSDTPKFVMARQETAAGVGGLGFRYVWGGKLTRNNAFHTSRKHCLENIS